MFRRPTILLAGDPSRFCDVVGGYLRHGFDIVGAVATAEAAATCTLKLNPDLVVIDVSIPLLTGVEAAARIRESNPATLVIFAGTHAGSETRLTKLGSLAFMIGTATASDLTDAIWNVLDDAGFTAGERARNADGHLAHLTTREREVVRLLAQGKLMKQVAAALKVSTRTVAFHKYGVMKKLGLQSSADLVRLAVSQGLVA
jgi:DNA-binding NarL/FixJ family response regulator